ncbi:hypothetical protein BKA70DRAFT_1573910 [Coprinopsis sp. MPI-PUGE-AT-0042]|nr:hypothetical protein BKA70DRAFT_1573910 [Coprinopsis sp. MPI-PUGE-AT-0042]
MDIDSEDQQANVGGRGKGEFSTLCGASHSASGALVSVLDISCLFDVLRPSGQTRIDTMRLRVLGYSLRQVCLRASSYPHRSSEIWLWKCCVLADLECHEAEWLEITNDQPNRRGGVWFSLALTKYVDRINNLLIDHSLLASLVAEDSIILWLGPHLVFRCKGFGRQIYLASYPLTTTGVYRSQFLSSYGSQLDALANSLLNSAAIVNTNIQRTDP